MKLARLYGEWHHLGALPADAETLSVTLNANDHSVFSVDGSVIAATLALEEIPGWSGVAVSGAELHPLTRQIEALLDDAGCWHETFAHAPARTSEEAAAARPGYSLAQGAKAIILRVKRTKKDKFFAMLVFPADRKFDGKRVKVHFGARDIRFATEAEVGELTGGVQPGGVPPFGNLFELPVYAAPELFERERIVFNAGDRRFSVAMRSADYRRLAKSAGVFIPLIPVLLSVS